MKVGDLVEVELESGLKDIGVIVRVWESPHIIGENMYEVTCSKTKAMATATVCMLRRINESR